MCSLIYSMYKLFQHLTVVVNDNLSPLYKHEANVAEMFSCGKLLTLPSLVITARPFRRLCRRLLVDLVLVLSVVCICPFLG